MKHYYTLLLSCLMLLGLSSFAQDTTIVRSHDDVHWNWYGSWDNMVDFPDASVDYRKVLLHYTIGCPSSGCSGWDYSTMIEIITDTADMGKNVEIARVMTPYGGYYTTSWEHTIIFDVTDYASILHDSTLVRAFYGGWSDGFSITLDFEFIEGTPARNPLGVENIYRSGPGGYVYGVAANPIEDHWWQRTSQ